ncbi:hypothetical protein [Micromonospora sp. CB01531]|nr:hypothetical protein [Micromonospora sp. CB01531]
MRRLTNQERKALVDFIADAEREAEARGEEYWGSNKIRDVEVELGVKRE